MTFTDLAEVIFIYAILKELPYNSYKNYKININYVLTM
jgi:hypothetical protein